MRGRKGRVEEMKHKPSDEFEKFNSTMDKLLAVPYAELKEKLEEEKRAKAKRKKKPTNAPTSSRVSSKVVSG